MSLTALLVPVLFHGVVIGAVMTAAGGAAHDSGGGHIVMAKASPSAGCGSGGMCGGGQTVAKAASTGGCGSGGCGSAAGGCGSGGCGAGGTVAAGKSACGCGSGAKTAGNQTLASSVTGKAPPAPMPNPNQMRPGLPSVMARPNATVTDGAGEKVQAGSLRHLGVPGVTNQPVSISPQAMTVVSAQPKMTLPRPAQGPPVKLTVPLNGVVEGNRSLTGPTAAAPSKLPPSTITPSVSNPPPGQIRATSPASMTPAAAKPEEPTPKEANPPASKSKPGEP